MATPYSFSYKCAATQGCKKTGLIKCDGCLSRFCADHFATHRRELEARLELLCVKRDAIHHNLSQICQNPTDSLAQIDTWEQETLICVRKTANNARRHIRDLAATTDNNEQLVQISDELRRRRKNDDYIEHDIERIQQQLDQLKTESIRESKITITCQPIDWSTIIRFGMQEQRTPVHRLFDDTSLLTFEQEAILNEFYGNYHQRWRLIYRGTRNGFGEGEFIFWCANQGPTMTVIVADGYLFGGYTNTSWKNSQDPIWSRDRKAFLFTLTNPHQIPPTKYPIKPAGDRAIRSCSFFGPTFGEYDLCIYSNSNTINRSYCNFPANYRDTTGRGQKTFTGKNNFKTSEIEVYKQV